MSDEQINDEVVSSAYRQLPAESSPAHLDEAVLRMAADHVQHARYARAITWTRPLAWAATIVLCLAITFQVTRVPDPEAVPAPAVMPAPEAMPAPEETSADVMMDTSAAPASAPVRAALPQKQEAAERRADALGDAAATAGRADTARADDPAAASAVFAVPTREAELLRQAEEMVRLQNGSNIEPAMQERALRGLTSDAAIAPCPDEARADPDRWLECIEALEEMGESEAAAIERESLLEVFPDFRLP